MKKLALSLGAVLVASAGSAAVGYKLAPGPNHERARILAIQSHLDQQPDAQVVVFGDSIVERADLSRACAAPTINAGVSGATIADVAGVADQIALRGVPRVIVSVGVNDAKAGARRPVDEVMTAYRDLVGHLSSGGRKVTLVSVSSPTSGDFDPDYIAAFNGALRMLATSTGARLIEATVLSDSDMIDGVHLNGGGYKKWTETLAPACA